jgi:hypothetical protein
MSTPEPGMMFGSDGVKGTTTGLIFSDGMDEPQWEEFGRRLGKAESAYQWMVGDWWNFGNMAYGNRIHVVKSPAWTGPIYETCANCGWVCRAFESSLRRELLTFRHHKEILSLRITDPLLAEEILDWCEEPIKEGKKPHSVAKMKAEINRRLNPVYQKIRKTRQETKSNLDMKYIDLVGCIGSFIDHPTFDIPALVRVQAEFFGSPKMIEEELSNCRKAVAIINEFIQGLEDLRQTPPQLPQSGADLHND